MHEFITMRDARSIVDLDLPIGTVADKEDCTKVVRLACNIYCSLVEDYADLTSAKLMAFRLKRCGLKVTSDGLSDLFYEMLGASFEALDGRDDDLYTIVCRAYEHSGALGVSQVCRFLKRFTYNTKSDDPATYEKFLDVNSHCWSDSDYLSTGKRGGDEVVADRKGIVRAGNTLLIMIKDEIRDMVGIVPPNLYELVQGSFSSGVTADGCHCIMDRVAAICNYDTQFMMWHDGLLHRCAPIRDSRKELRFRIANRDTYPTCIQVPKSMNKKRLICPEPSVRAFRSSKVLRVLRNRLKHSGTAAFINERDQDVNKWLARIGSVTGEFASIDLSSASDSQSRAYTILVFPESWRPYLTDSISDIVYVGTKRTRVRCFSTSGNKLTWLVEAIYFLAICRVAARWYDPALVEKCFAYGDDIIVPTELFDTVCELLRILGCTVNDDKSYAVGAFRESCGGDYYAGECITPVYWPRQPLSFEEAALPQTLASLCSLQHALYDHIDCRLQINDAVLRIAPKTTFSPIGADCVDLWDGSGTFTGHHVGLRTHYHKRSKLVRDHGKVTEFAFDEKGIPRSFQEWRYYEFLLNGPRYLTEEDKAWGISTSYLSDADMDPNPQYTWG